MACRGWPSRFCPQNRRIRGTQYLYRSPKNHLIMHKTINFIANSCSYATGGKCLAAKAGKTMIDDRCVEIALRELAPKPTESVERQTLH